MTKEQKQFIATRTAELIGKGWRPAMAAKNSGDNSNSRHPIYHSEQWQ